VHASGLAFDPLVHNFNGLDRNSFVLRVEARCPPPGQTPATKPPARRFFSVTSQEHDTPVSSISREIPFLERRIGVKGSLKPKGPPLSIVDEEPRRRRTSLLYGEKARRPTEAVAACKTNAGHPGNFDAKVARGQRLCIS
jgi:hypothetical protein